MALGVIVMLVGGAAPVAAHSHTCNTGDGLIGSGSGIGTFQPDKAINNPAEHGPLSSKDEQRGGLLGAVFGSAFGPVGIAVGYAVGEELDDC